MGRPPTSTRRWRAARPLRSRKTRWATGRSSPSCAAGNGELGRSIYRGIAPGATIVAARIAAAGSETIGNDELLRGTGFLFDRGDALGQPIGANLSIGSDFGPHDGTTAWEQSLASHVGPTQPGHALIVAGGNSGSIVDTPVHQNVFVSATSTLRVPLYTPGSLDGGVQVWVAMHDGARLSVGLDGPDGTWISPVSPEASASKTTSTYQAGIFNGPDPAGSPIPKSSHGAVVGWQGEWPIGTYFITLSGSGAADLYIQGSGDVAEQGSVGFIDAVRESTVSLPATHPAIIGVGCSINKARWVSLRDTQLGLDAGVGIAAPVLDSFGGLPAAGHPVEDPVSGEPCWFSSAGPNLEGLEKPEIMAPGGAIVGAMSAQAAPGGSASIFTNASCPSLPGGAPDPTCMQVDATHAAALGTSFSAPIVAGAIAVMFQHDPTLTQPQILAALQGGAHPARARALRRPVRSGRGRRPRRRRGGRPAQEPAARAPGRVAELAHPRGGRLPRRRLDAAAGDPRAARVALGRGELRRRRPTGSRPAASARTPSSTAHLTRAPSRRSTGAALASGSRRTRCRGASAGRS